MSYSTLISTSELAKHLHDPNWIIFDCRFSLADAEAGHHAYRQGHIEGARYADLNKDLSSAVKSYTGRHPLPNFSELANKLGVWGANNRSQTWFMTMPAALLLGGCGGYYVVWDTRKLRYWMVGLNTGKNSVYRKPRHYRKSAPANFAAISTINNGSAPNKLKTAWPAEA